MRFREPPYPSPMPDVARARVYLPDAIRALERAQQAWNAAQLRDAIRSAEHFIAATSKALEANPVPMPQPGTLA